MLGFAGTENLLERMLDWCGGAAELALLEPEILELTFIFGSKRREIKTAL